MDKVIKKQRRSWTGHQSLLRSRNKFRKIPLFVIYYLTKFDDEMYSRFWVIPIHDIKNYSTSICPFEPGKCGKEGKVSLKFEYLENEKSFLDEIKNISIVFKGVSFG